MAVNLSRHHLGSCAPCPRQSPKARDSFIDILEKLYQRKHGISFPTF